MKTDHYRIFTVITGLLCICLCPVFCYADDYAKAEMLLSLVLQQKKLVDSYECTMDMFIDNKKFEELKASESGASSDRPMAKFNEIKIRFDIKFKHPEYTLTEFKGSAADETVSGKIFFDGYDFIELIENPRGKMAFVMDMAEAYIEDLLTMTDNSQPGIKFGSGICVHELMGPKATTAVFEHLLAYYRFSFRSFGTYNNQEMLVLELERKQGITPEIMRILKLPLFPKLVLWIGKQDLFLHRTHILDNRNNPIIMADMKNLRINTNIASNIFKLDIPEGMNKVEMSPLLSTLKVMRDKQLEVFGTTPDTVTRTVRKSPGMIINTVLPDLQIKSNNADKDWVSWAPKPDQPVLAVVWSFKDETSKILIPGLSTLQKIARDQNFGFINIVTDDDIDTVKTFLNKHDIDLNVYIASEKNMELLKPQMLPAIYLFNENRKLVWCDGGMTAWSDLVLNKDTVKMNISLLEGMKKYSSYLSKLRAELIHEYYPYLEISRKPSMSGNE